MRGTEQGRGGTARTGGRALTIALLALLLGASQAGLPLASAASIAADSPAADSPATLRSIPVPAGAFAAIPSVRVLSSWPARCLTPVSRTSGAGLLAAVLRGRVTIASPVGGTPVMLPVRLTADEASVGWSPDGRYLATGDGRLWTSKGKAAGRLFDSLTGFWGWSSVADCALGVTGGPTGFTPNRVLSVGMPGSHSKPFLRGNISDFAFTPDGRSLIVVVELGTTTPVTAGFWRVNLRTGSVTQLARLTTETCCVHLAGVAPGGRLLWFWGAPGGSVMADGWPLTGLDVTRAAAPITYGTPARPTMTLPRADFVTACGAKTLAVVGLFRVATTVTDKRLAYVAPGRLPTYLTPSSRAFFSVACSPDGRYIVAGQTADGASAARARLTLLTSGGTVIGYLSPGGAWADGRPEWVSSGLVFERVPATEAPTQLWFVPSRGTSRATGVTVDAAYAHAWDWSATPPSGRSNT